jgi:hypothetical protein
MFILTEQPYEAWLNDLHDFIQQKLSNVRNESMSVDHQRRIGKIFLIESETFLDACDVCFDIFLRTEFPYKDTQCWFEEMHLTEIGDFDIFLAHTEETHSTWEVK